MVLAHLFDYVVMKYKKYRAMRDTIMRNNWLIMANKDFTSGSAMKNLPARRETQETQVQSLGWEDPLEEGMATHSRILAWRIPWKEEPGGLQFIGSQRVDTIEVNERAQMHCQ